MVTQMLRNTYDRLKDKWDFQKEIESQKVMFEKYCEFLKIE